MRSNRLISTIETHVEGLAYRVVTGGVGRIPGDSMRDRRNWMIEHGDDLRTLLMCEPRGHSALSGAILQPPTIPDVDYGVVFIEVTGFMPMCGAGTIAVATALVESGMVPAREPVTTVRLETPLGLVTAEVVVESGRAANVTITGVPAYMYASDVELEIDDYGSLTCDIVFGGNFYAMVELSALNIPYQREASDQIIQAGLSIMRAVNDQYLPTHPTDPSISGCLNTIFIAPESTSLHTRHVMINHPGWIDRSPSGTGTGARIAQLVARGLMTQGEELINESFLGTRFVGRIAAATEVGGQSAVLPRVSGRAWLTGTANYFRDPEDPFPAGFLL
ncbi:proline racemase [Mycobacterium goodii]|nr:proline racemase [Mycolicibacterium goodii]